MPAGKTHESMLKKYCQQKVIVSFEQLNNSESVEFWLTNVFLEHNAYLSSAVPVRRPILSISVVRLTRLSLCIIDL